jgi:hypothetical protein
MKTNREYTKRVKQSCGCVNSIVTLNYKPDYSKIRNQVCPKCFMVNLMKEEK